MNFHEMTKTTDFIKNIMNSPIGISSQTKLVEVLNKLLTHRISRIIIYESEKPIGIVSEKDILSFLFTNKLHQNIDQISVNEMIHQIYFADGNKTIEQAAKFMIDHKCSSIAVGTKNNLEGIVTKTDLTKYYSENNEGQKKVSDCMSLHYFSVFTNDALYDVIKTMLGFGISRIVIIDHQRKPVGLISTGDIFRAVLNVESIDSMKRIQETPKDYEEFWSRYGFFCSQPSGKIMTKKILKIIASEDLATACKLMIDKNVNALGVADSDGSLAGIIGKRDILLTLAS